MTTDMTPPATKKKAIKKLTPVDDGPNTQAEYEALWKTPEGMEALKEARKSLPTAFEIALLAATLAKGQVIVDWNARGLAEQACLLCEAAEQSLNSKAKSAALLDLPGMTVTEAIPLPAKFPASLPDFLREFVVGRWRNESLPVFSRYLAHRIRAGKGPGAYAERPETTAEEVAAEIKRLESGGFDRDLWNDEARSFAIWKQRDRQKTRVN